MKILLKLITGTALVVVIILLFQGSINNGKEKKSTVSGYDLSNPNDVFLLENELHEISGLSSYTTNQVLAVQDEKGIVYVYNLEKRKVVERYKFSGKDDYEGIEAVGSNVFVINSSGDVFKIKHLRNSDRTTTKYKTKLSSKNDTEGLAFDFKKEQLLIACKEAHKLDGDGHKKRAVYRFSIDNKEIKKNPLLKLEIDEVLSMTNHAKDFKPSGIAIHPITKDIYVIDSVGKTILVVDDEGKIISIEELDTDLFNQPEGITFFANGTLLIANEGGASQANILQFNYTPEE